MEPKTDGAKSCMLTESMLEEHLQRLQKFIEVQLNLQTSVLKGSLRRTMPALQSKLEVPDEVDVKEEDSENITNGSQPIVAFDPDKLDGNADFTVDELLSPAEDLRHRHWQVGRGSSRYSFVRETMAGRKERASQYVSGEIRHSGLVSGADGSQRRCFTAHDIVASRWFVHGMMGLIVLNLVLLGVEVDVASRLPLSEVPSWFSVVNLIIVSMYVVEILLKLGAYGFRGFFLGPEKIWNNFDFAIILVSLSETIFEVMTLVNSRSNADSSYLRSIRFIRVVRALRGVRVIRLIHYIGALRTLVFSIMSTAGSLFWTLLLLILVFYIFGVIIAQIVTDHCREFAQRATGQMDALPSCEKDAANQYWFGVTDSMFTLFMAITGGISWEDALKPLRDISAVAVLCMVLYIVIAVFAILNVVTGVFCNTAIESAQADRDIAIMKYMARHKTQVEALRDIFVEIDQDGSSLVSIDELKAAMTKQKLAGFMESLDISTHDIWSLFLIIDADESGLISLDEFVSGCMQLHGPAKSFQLAKMSYENKVTRQEIKHLSVQVSQLQRYFGLDVQQALFWARRPTSSSSNSG